VVTTIPGEAIHGGRPSRIATPATGAAANAATRVACSDSDAVGENAGIDGGDMLGWMASLQLKPSRRALPSSRCNPPRHELGGQRHPMAWTPSAAAVEEARGARALERTSGSATVRAC